MRTWPKYSYTKPRQEAYEATAAAATASIECCEGRRKDGGREEEGAICILFECFFCLPLPPNYWLVRFFETHRQRFRWAVTPSQFIGGFRRRGAIGVQKEEFRRSELQDSEGVRFRIQKECASRFRWTIFRKIRSIIIFFWWRDLEESRWIQMNHFQKKKTDQK